MRSPAHVTCSSHRSTQLAMMPLMRSRLAAGIIAGREPAEAVVVAYREPVPEPLADPVPLPAELPLPVPPVTLPLPPMLVSTSSEPVPVALPLPM